LRRALKRQSSAALISGDPNRWVQFIAGTINAAYPHNEAPESRLDELGLFALREWTPNNYITGILALEGARSVAHWIDHYSWPSPASAASLSFRL
jgi:hypothetical protein